jgi:hypothetical protein
MFGRRRSLALAATVASLSLAALAGYVNQRVMRAEWCGRTPGAAFVSSGSRAGDLCRALVPTWQRAPAPALGAGGPDAVLTAQVQGSFWDHVRESLPLSAPIAAMVLALAAAWLRRREGFVWLGVLVIALMLAGTNVAMLALSQTAA